MDFNIENFSREKEREICKEISTKWEKLDYFLFKNKDKKFKVVKFKTRKIQTKFGLTSFKRRIYKYYNIESKKWMYTALLDKELQIKKYKRLYKDVYNHIVNFLGDGKRYRDIIDTLPNCKISKMEISRIFKNLELKTKIKEKIKVKDNEYIYINVDDCFQTVLKNNKKELHKIRIISFNLGIDKFNSRNKNILKHKKISFIYNQKEHTASYHYLNENKTVKFIWQKLNEYYEFDLNKVKIVLGGDGANWIKTIAEYLQAFYIFDRWHALKLLWAEYKPNIGRRKLKLLRINYINYMTAKEYFVNGKYDHLIQFLEDTKVSKNTLSTFKNNKNGIINQNKDWNIGVSAESDVFHFVKSLKGNGSKIYSEKVFMNMINYKIAKANNELLLNF